MKYSLTEIYSAISVALNNLSTKDDFFMYLVLGLAVKLSLSNSSCNEKHIFSREDVDGDNSSNIVFWWFESWPSLFNVFGSHVEN